MSCSGHEQLTLLIIYNIGDDILQTRITRHTIDHKNIHIL